MAHTYDTKANLIRGRSASGRDLSYTCGAGATLLVLGIVVDGLTARTGGAPTYNGVALTQASTNAQASLAKPPLSYGICSVHPQVHPLRFIFPTITMCISPPRRPAIRPLRDIPQSCAPPI